MNSDFDDIGDALTASLARDGQGGMTAILPLANGGVTYTSDPNTGLKRTAADTQVLFAGGVDVLEVSATGAEVDGDLNVTGDLQINGVDLFPVGTANIADTAVTYPKIRRPGAPSLLLGSSSIASTAVSGAADNGAGLIRLTVGSTTDYLTGMSKVVTGVLGTTEANGTWTITVVDGTHVDLDGSTFTNNYSGGGTLGGSVENIAISSGLQLDASNNLTVTAQPIAAGFKNLRITNNAGSPNTQVDISADAVTVETVGGIAYRLRNVSLTNNLGSVGAGGLDVGPIAAATFYAVYIIYNPTTQATSSLTSTNATTPTLPSGYTAYARFGWVRTASGSAQLLGIRQLGRQARYVSGLAQSTTIPQITNGNAGNVSIPTWVSLSVSSFVPPTASQIVINAYVNGATVIAAPNSTYGAPASTTNPPPVISNNAGQFSLVAMFLLEATSIQYAITGGTGYIYCLGWEDNL